MKIKFHKAYDSESNKLSLFIEFERRIIVVPGRGDSMTLAVGGSSRSICCYAAAALCVRYLI